MKKFFSQNLKEIDFSRFKKLGKILVYLIVLLGLGFLVWRGYLMWQDYQQGEILPPSSLKVNKNRIEEELKAIESREDYGPLLKEKEGGRANPFAPY